MCHLGYQICFAVKGQSLLFGNQQDAQFVPVKAFTSMGQKCDNLPWGLLVCQLFIFVLNVRALSPCSLVLLVPLLTRIANMYSISLLTYQPSKR